MKRAAFTLAEVLLAVVILALICSIAYAITAQTVDAKMRSEKQARLLQIGLALTQRIRADLESVYIFGIDDPFRGTCTDELPRLDFVAAVRSYPDESELRHPLCEVGYELVENEDDSRYKLLLRRENPGVAGSPLAGGVKRVLYDFVRSFEIAYWDRDEQQWYDSWSFKEKKGLPGAVRVTIELDARPRPEEEEVVVEGEEAQVSRGRFTVTVTMPIADDHLPPEPKE